MRRAYADIADPEGSWQIHYRESGQGAPLVLLHPSPLSSQSLAAQMEVLAGHFRCIAWDTPGYGYSDSLPESAEADATLTPYVRSLGAFLDALGIYSPLIYGSATGAQIALEFARALPQRCAGLLLENAALFDEQEVTTLLEGYFPDIRPREDGSHLVLLWRMAQRSTRYFPWYADDAQAERRPAYLPAPLIDYVVRDHLLAGPDYDRAYRAAFANERAEPLQALTVNTRILLWEEGLLGEFAERVDKLALPDCVVVRRAKAGMPARFAALLDCALELQSMPPHALETRT